MMNQKIKRNSFIPPIFALFFSMSCVNADNYKYDDGCGHGKAKLRLDFKNRAEWPRRLFVTNTNKNTNETVIIAEVVLKNNEDKSYDFCMPIETTRSNHELKIDWVSTNDHNHNIYTLNNFKLITPADSYLQWWSYTVAAVHCDHLACAGDIGTGQLLRFTRAQMKSGNCFNRWDTMEYFASRHLDSDCSNTYEGNPASIKMHLCLNDRRCDR